MSGGGGEEERWLITYADMITLLMVFFVVMFASSQTQQAKLMALSDSLKKALHMSAAAAANGTGAALMAAPRTAERTTAVTEAIREAAKALGIDKGVTVTADERGTVISLVDTFFFDSAEATIRPHARPVLAKVAEFIAATESTIYVEGHTDDQRIHKGLISSNWVLSSLRACEVVEYFLATNRKIEKHRLVAVGYGDTRPLFPNDSPEHRARNRRVDIVLVSADPRRSQKPGEKRQVDVLAGEAKFHDGDHRKTTAHELHGGIGIKEGHH